MLPLLARQPGGPASIHGLLASDRAGGAGFAVPPLLLSPAAGAPGAWPGDQIAKVVTQVFSIRLRT
jgi:hypothetical protein